MNEGQQTKIDHAWRKYWAAGGRLDVDGVPQGGLDKLVASLSCLDASQIESLLSDMATLQTMAEELQHGNQYIPDDIPSKNSKPRLHVSCSSNSWGVTWS